MNISTERPLVLSLLTSPPSTALLALRRTLPGYTLLLSIRISLTLLVEKVVTDGAAMLILNCVLRLFQK